MRILLTGGSSDLGNVLTKQLENRGDISLRMDIRPPMTDYGIYINGSILDDF